MSNFPYMSIMFAFIVPSIPYIFSSSRTFKLIIVTLLSIDIFYLTAYLSGSTALVVDKFSASSRGLLVIAYLDIASCDSSRWSTAFLI